MKFIHSCLKSIFFGSILFMLTVSPSHGSHNTGQDCLKCHSGFAAAGSFFADSTGSRAFPDAGISFIGENGGDVMLDHTDTQGNFYAPGIPNGAYLAQAGGITSRTWHRFPGQGSCNFCHILGGNGSEKRTRLLPTAHTSIPTDNDCTHCHHFPASMSYTQLRTGGVLNAAARQLPLPGSTVEIAGKKYPFNPSDYTIATVRPDIFAPGFYSMFDVILAAAKKNGIPIEYGYDESCKTHFITAINGIKDDYWYHFSYDAGSQKSSEIQYRRANRWDEALWRWGVDIKVVTGENMEEIKQEFRDEINREKAQGHVIPGVTISLNPSSYKGNPQDSERITVTREYKNVIITPHNMRSTGYPSPYSKPFQPGVVTSLDILLSLMDQKQLYMVTAVFYSYFARNYIDSYYVVALGFPGIGAAHASGRQGFVYVTSNGSMDRLPNNADSKLHMTSDIFVVHAPDFSYWRWAELGNPYYENTEPSPSAVDPFIEEDFQAIGRGFNLHDPSPNPFNGSLIIPFNVFSPGRYTLSVFNIAGQKVAAIFDGMVNTIGYQEIQWKPGGISSGVYLIVLRNSRSIQVKSVSYIK